MFPDSANILTNKGIMRIADLRSHHKLVNPMTLAWVNLVAVQTRTMTAAEIENSYVMASKGSIAKGAPAQPILLSRKQSLFAKTDERFELVQAETQFQQPTKKLCEEMAGKFVGFLTEKEMPILVNGMVVLSVSNAKAASQVPTATPDRHRATVSH